MIQETCIFAALCLQLSAIVLPMWGYVTKDNNESADIGAWKICDVSAQNSRSCTTVFTGSRRPFIYVLRIFSILSAIFLMMALFCVFMKGQYETYVTSYLIAASVCSLVCTVIWLTKFKKYFTPSTGYKIGSNNEYDVDPSISFYFNLTPIIVTTGLILYNFFAKKSPLK